MNALSNEATAAAEPASLVGFSPDSSLRSSPAVKARSPAPVRITTPTESSASSSTKARVSSARTSFDNAFMALGRFRVTRATPSCFSTRTTGSDKVGLLDGAALRRARSMAQRGARAPRRVSNGAGALARR